MWDGTQCLCLHCAVDTTAYFEEAQMEQGAPLFCHWGSSLQTLSGGSGEETIWVWYLKQVNLSSLLLNCTSVTVLKLSGPLHAWSFCKGINCFFFLSTAASPCVFYLLFVCYLCQSISQLDTSFLRSPSPFTRIFIAWQQELNMCWFSGSPGCFCSMTALQAPEWRCLGAACCLSSRVSFLVPGETEEKQNAKGDISEEAKICILLVLVSAMSV